MIRLIAAIDRKRGIAKQGIQPWYIVGEQRHFAEQTKLYGGNILVGATTFQQIFNGQPLPDRQNYVLTHDKTPVDDVELVPDLEKFLHEFQSKDLWVIGGANLFAQVMELNQADELYLTQIEADFGCNQFFPPFDTSFTISEKGELQEQNGFLFSYNKYVKVSPNN